MKNILVTRLRDRETTIDEFRQASDLLATLLAYETANHLEKSKITVQTPLMPTDGVSFKNSLVLVPILRAGLAMMFPFLKIFTHARVGMMGLQRDEATAVAHSYYNKVPRIGSHEDVVVLDPMLATGGTVTQVIKYLVEKGVPEQKITLVSVISAPEGEKKLHKAYPKVKVIVAAEDEKLNEHFYITPGLGDYGDRYFGTI